MKKGKITSDLHIFYNTLCLNEILNCKIMKMSCGKFQLNILIKVVVWFRTIKVAIKQ